MWLVDDREMAEATVGRDKKIWVMISLGRRSKYMAGIVCC